jgi:hypothetical protein
MRWMKIGPACEFMGGVNPKLVYAAVRARKLKAAHVGFGRNLMFCDEWCTEYMRQTDEDYRNQEKRPAAEPPLALVHAGGKRGVS